MNLLGNGKIVSPTDYNYRTDTLYFDVDIEQCELDKILPCVIDDVRFWEWSYENYRSRSGFWSSMPYLKENYIKAIQGKDIERAVSMYLTYIYDDRNNFKEPEFGHKYDLYENISECHGLAEFINDDKFSEIFIKAYDGQSVKVEETRNL